MSLQDRYIEQCTAEEVLSVITDNLVQNPVNRAVNKMDEVKAKSDDILADTGGTKSLIGTPATGQPSTLFAALAASGGVPSPVADELAAGKAAIVAALNERGESASVNESLAELADKIRHSLALVIYDSTFSPATPTDFSSVFNTKITRLEGNTQTFPSSFNGFLQDCIKEMVLPQVTSLPLTNVFSNFYVQVEYMFVPSISIAPTGYDSPFGRNGGRKVRRICTSIAGYGSGASNGLFTYQSMFGGSNNVYYIELPNGIASSLYLANLMCTNAISANEDLLNKAVYDDPNEPTSSFTNNKDKFLWYFEYHFIPFLNETTASPTLSLYSAVYNVINESYSKEQPTKTLKEVIEDKGWTVASV